MNLRVAVLGGGNGSHAAVVDMVGRGFDVRWWRRDPRSFVEGGAIQYSGVLGEGVANARLATADLGEALGGADLVVVPLPSTSHDVLMPRLVRHLAAGQVVALTPGTFGSWIGARLRPDVVFMETGTLPYLARLVGSARVEVPVVASRLPVGSIPGVGIAAGRAHEVFREAYPTAVRLTSGLDAALANWGPVIHPPLIVHNLGAIESLGSRFDIHAEGTSPGVKHTILRLDEERVALRNSLGIPGGHWEIRHHYDRSPLGMYPPEGHDRLVASNLWRESVSVEHRYVQEDVLRGLVLNASLARLAHVPAVTAEALLTLLGGVLHLDPFAIGLSASSLGITSVKALLGTAREGFRD